MFLRSLPPVLLVLASLVSAQSFSDLSACGQTCINNMDTSTGCVPVTAECLCGNANFLFGIADCANAACSAADAAAAVTYAKSSCSAVITPTVTATTTSTTIEGAPAATPETPTTTDTPTTTAIPTTTALAESLLPTAVTTSSESSPAAANAQSSPTTVASVATTASFASTFKTSINAAVATTTSAATSAADLQSSGTGTSGSSTTATTAKVAASIDGTAVASPSSSPSAGLTTADKAGIVVGALVAAAAMVGFMLCLSRKRKPAPSVKSNYKISPPLPGAGRVGDRNDEWEGFNKVQNSPMHSPQYSPQYPYPPPTAALPRNPRNVYSVASNMSELSRNARPYEEMVPRTTPARMV